MTGAAVILKALQDQGVEVVFGYPGGAVLPIYDELFKPSGTPHPGAPRTGAPSRRRGLCPLDRQDRRGAGDLGPRRDQRGHRPYRRADGFDPDRVLTGQVPTHLIGNDAFQEADTDRHHPPCTKHNYLVKDPTSWRESCTRRLRRLAGRPGPVVDRSAQGHPVRRRHPICRPTIER